MNEQQLIQLWQTNWNRIVISQLAPTGLLITTIALCQFGLTSSTGAVKVAALFILLASGILGALAQYSAATEAIDAAAALKKAGTKGPVVAGIQRNAKYLFVVKFVTPAIFTVIFVLLAVALLS
jgi:hypothetical protein